MATPVKFLTETPSFTVELPPRFGGPSAPDLYSVVLLDGGARELLYEPSDRRPHPREDSILRLLWSTDRGGYEVLVLESRDEPRYTAVFWVLPAGFISTFVQDQSACGSDIQSGVGVLLDSIHVVETASGLPTVVIAPPLSSGDPREPIHRDAAWFRSNTDETDWMALRLQRLPGWVRAGTFAESDEAVAQYTVRTDAGLEVMCVGPVRTDADVRAAAAMVAASAA